MKTKKYVSKAVADDYPNSYCDRLVRQRLYGIRPQFSGPMPSPVELATLAAALASGPDDNPEKLCGSALKLWFASHEAITLQQFFNEERQKNEKYEADIQATLTVIPQAPEDQKWPMTLQDFCRIFWPDKDTGDRAIIIRAFLKYVPDGYSYAAMNSEPIDEDRFYVLRDTILPWYQEWKEEDISRKRREAGAKAKKKLRPVRERRLKVFREAVKEGQKEIGLLT